MGNFRKWMASLSVVALLSTLVVSTAAFADGGHEFADDDVSDECLAQAEALVDMDLLAANDEFNGNEAPTRAEGTKMIMSALGYDQDAVNGVDPKLDLYSDVPDTHWFYDEGYSTVAYTEGIATGKVKPVVDGAAVTTQGEYDPDTAITLAEMGKMLKVAGGEEFEESEDGSWWELESDYLTETFGNEDFDEGGDRCLVAEVVYAEVAEDDGGDDDDDDDDEVVESTGGLWIEVSDASPEETGKIPNGSVDTYTIWDFTAIEGDVKVTSVTVSHGGAGDNDEVAALVLKDADGARLSKVKTSINSDEEATLTMLDGGYTIMEGDTLEVHLIAQADGNGTGDANVGDHSFGIMDADDVAANADVDGDFSAFGALREYIESAGPTVDITEDSDVADVKVGESAVPVSSFSVEANGNDDIWFSRITLRDNGSASLDDAITNPMLLNDGDEVGSCVVDDEYISCELDEALEIKESTTEDFEVVADVISEAGRTLQLYLENAIDFEGTSDDGFGAGATNNLDSTDVDAFDIEAGAVTIIEGSHADTVRRDKDNVVGAVMYVTAAGSEGDASLEFEALNATLTTATENVEDLVENIELYDVATGSTYDLTVDDGNSTSADVYDRDLGIFLEPGTEYEFQLRFDTLDVATVNDDTFTWSTTAIGDGTTTDGLEFKEPQDDEYATDVTPSSITFETIDGQASSVDLSLRPISADNVVVGAEGVLLLEFEIEETAGVSDVTVEQLSVIDVNSNLDSTFVSQLMLYTVVDDVETLVKTKSGSQASGDEITFNNLSELVAMEDTLTFRVYGDFVDDAGNDGNDIELRIQDYDFEDDESDAVYVGQDDGDTGDTENDGIIGPDEHALYDVSSGMVASLVSAGILYVETDTTDLATDQARWVLGGSTSDFVASYQLRGEDEEVLVEDFRITATEDAGNFEDLIDEVVVYADDQTTEIARKSVTDNTVDFSNVNITVGESAENWYLKLVANSYGQDEIGTLDDEAITLALQVIDSDAAVSASGVSSQDDYVAGAADESVAAGEVVYNANPTVNATYDEAAETDSGASNEIGYLAQMISEVDLVDSYSGTSLASTISNGSNNIAILMISTASSTNDETTGADGKVYLSDITVNLEAALADDANDSDMFPTDSLTMERINGSTGVTLISDADFSGVADNTWNAVVLFDVDDDAGDAGADDDLGVDVELDPGTTAYYLIKATLTSLDGETNGYGFLQVDLDDLDAVNFEFADSSAAADKTALRLDYDDIDGTKISEN
jgi:hypothetical protein